MTAILVYAAFGVAGRIGFRADGRGRRSRTTRGACSRPRRRPPEGWLRLGSWLGLPIVWMIGSLLAIPLVVYVITYIPWALVEGHQLWPGVPAGHTGQTLLQLTGEMSRYRDNLTAPHAASSPWWAWPLNLKPVWFYQGSFANSTAASIYDAGNVILWWVGIPAMVFVAYQAFKTKEPRARADPRRLPVPVDLLGSDRPRGLPVPLPHEPAVPVHGARLAIAGQCSVLFLYWLSSVCSFPAARS